MEKRIIFAGSGGQGILFLGRLTAYSGMLEGKEITWFPSYGAEMRGGTANCTVIIADEIIGSPVTRNPDILVTMNAASYNRFLNRVLPNGILLYDSSLISNIKHRDDIRIFEVSASEIASALNNTNLTNMVMMGALVGITQLFNIDSVIKALDEITSSRRRESLNINKDLIIKGYDLFQKNKKSKYI